jgi:acyl carrier protein
VSRIVRFIVECYDRNSSRAHALRQPTQERSGYVAALVRRRWRPIVTDMETLVQAAIVKVCGIDVERIDPSAQLADIGVDSLAAAEVLVELEIQLDKQLPVDVLRRLEQVETVRDIAAQLDLALQNGPSAV